MKNVSHKKGRNLWTNPVHVEPLPIILTKEQYNGKSDGDFVKLKCCRYPTSIMSELYESNMSLFDHSNAEEFLLFIPNFNMTLAATGTLEMDTNIKYISTLVHGEALGQF